VLKNSHVAYTKNEEVLLFQSFSPLFDPVQKSPLKPAGFFVHEGGRRLCGRPTAAKENSRRREACPTPHNKKKISQLDVALAVTIL